MIVDFVMSNRNSPSKKGRKEHMVAPLEIRRPDSNTLVVFVHGFTGHAEETWGRFPALLEVDLELNDHDFIFWGYPTRLNPAYVVTKFFWSNDPDIETIGQGLRSLLDHNGQYEKVVLVGHSMGGLVIQSFVIEELLRGNHRHISRLTEVVLYGTPSGGLLKASIAAPLKNQIADMSMFGPFIGRLRTEWRRWHDDPRADPARPAAFHLTVVAGMRDTFVPLSSSIEPFPLDEKVFLSGNHSEIVRPASTTDLVYLTLKQRLQRGTVNAAGRKYITGEDEGVVLALAQVQAAAELNDTAALLELMGEQNRPGAPLRPLVDRALGLALLNQECYAEAVDALGRYLTFEIPVEGSRPFATDSQAIQQLAIARSGNGDDIGAIADLNVLMNRIGRDAESLGILGGRFKRRWLQDEAAVTIGLRALHLYREGFSLAQEEGDPAQSLYNGINAAYLSFALHEDHEKLITLAREVLTICDQQKHPDYWIRATQSEALVLLGAHDEADIAYLEALGCGPQPRDLRTTQRQLLQIMGRQGQSSLSTKLAGRLTEAVEDWNHDRHA